MTYKIPQVDAIEPEDSAVLVRDGIAVRIPIAGLDLGGDEEIRTESYYDGGPVVTGYGEYNYRFRYKPTDFGVVLAGGGAALEKRPFIEHSGSVWFEPSMIGAVPSSVKIQSATYNLDKRPFIDHSNSVWFEPSMIGALPFGVRVQSSTYNFDKSLFQDIGGTVFLNPEMLPALPAATVNSTTKVRSVITGVDKDIFEEASNTVFIRPAMLRNIPLSAISPELQQLGAAGKLRNIAAADLGGTAGLSSGMTTVLSINLPLDNIGPRPVFVTYSINAAATRSSAGDLGVNIRTAMGAFVPLTDHAMIGAAGVTNIRGTTTFAYGALLGSTSNTTAVISLQARSVNATSGSVFRARITVLEFSPEL